MKENFIILKADQKFDFVNLVKLQIFEMKWKAKINFGVLRGFVSGIHKKLIIYQLQFLHCRVYTSLEHPDLSSLDT